MDTYHCGLFYLRGKTILNETAQLDTVLKMEDGGLPFGAISETFRFKEHLIVPEPIPHPQISNTFLLFSLFLLPSVLMLPAVMRIIL